MHINWDISDQGPTHTNNDLLRNIRLCKIANEELFV